MPDERKIIKSQKYLWGRKHTLYTFSDTLNISVLENNHKITKIKDKDSVNRCSLERMGTNHKSMWS